MCVRFVPRHDVGWTQKRPSGLHDVRVLDLRSLTLPSAPCHSGPPSLGVGPTLPVPMALEGPGRPTPRVWPGPTITAPGCPPLQGPGPEGPIGTH